MEKELSKIKGLKEKFKCNNCNTEQEINIFPYINFNKNPDYYEIVKNLSIFNVECENCHNNVLIKYDAMYLNEDKKYLIYILSDINMINSFRHQIRYIVESSLNTDDKYNFDEFTSRLVFNFNELIEKLSIFELGLNDKIIEILKYSLYKDRIDGSLEFDSVYFDGLNGVTLEFVLLNSKDEEKYQRVGLNIEHYNKFVDKLIKIKFNDEFFTEINRGWVEKQLSENLTN